MVSITIMDQNSDVMLLYVSTEIMMLVTNASAYIPY
jgi:hypothetical protein